MLSEGRASVRGQLPKLIDRNFATGTAQESPMRSASRRRATADLAEKLEEEQKALKMKFVLNRERQEAERKRIEAQGISDFQKIVSAGISEALLRWKGIEATEKLALSQNSKIVVVGSGKDGLPIILGGAN